MKSLFLILTFLLGFFGYSQSTDNITTEEVYDYLIDKFDDDLDINTNFNKDDKFDYVKIGNLNIGEFESFNYYSVVDEANVCKAVVCERIKDKNTKSPESSITVIPINNLKLEVKYQSVINRLKKNDKALFEFAYRYFLVNKSIQLITDNAKN